MKIDREPHTCILQLEATPLISSSPNKHRDTGFQLQICRNYNDEQKGYSFSLVSRDISIPYARTTTPPSSAQKTETNPQVD